MKCVKAYKSVNVGVWQSMFSPTSLLHLVLNRSISGSKSSCGHGSLSVCDNQNHVDVSPISGVGCKGWVYLSFKWSVVFIGRWLSMTNILLSMWMMIRIVDLGKAVGLDCECSVFLYQSHPFLIYVHFDITSLHLSTILLFFFLLHISHNDCLSEVERLYQKKKATQIETRVKDLLRVVK